MYYKNNRKEWMAHQADCMQNMRGGMCHPHTCRCKDGVKGHAYILMYMVIISLQLYYMYIMYTLYHKNTLGCNVYTCTCKTQLTGKIPGEGNSGGNSRL